MLILQLSFLFIGIFKMIYIFKIFSLLIFNLFYYSIFLKLKKSFIDKITSFL
jgi:hypothetical protein